MKIETPILKRIGPVPFWRGGEKCLDTLEGLYARAAGKAAKALAGGENAPPRRRVRKIGN